MLLVGTPAPLLDSPARHGISFGMVKIALTRRRAKICSRPPLDTTSQGISLDTFEWACCMCTNATYLCAGVQKRVDERVFRVAYVGIRPAMEAALKSLWVMGKVKKKTPPQSLGPLVVQVEEAFPNLCKIFSVQMSVKDALGNDAYRKVNGWAHADPEMWNLYKNGQEIDHVLKPLQNMVMFAQVELLKYDPTLVTDQRYWTRKYE
jgi:hypothetical protein